MSSSTIWVNKLIFFSPAKVVADRRERGEVVVARDHPRQRIILPNMTGGGAADISIMFGGEVEDVNWIVSVVGL